MGLPTELLEGYRRFRFDRYAEEAERYRGLAEGQSPRTMVIACADSRVDPATIFGARPGELFVVRNVAAIVPPYEEYGGYHGTSAAIEFAVTSLEVKTIVVMGHGQCGGIAAALAAADSRPVGRFIAPWVALLDGIRDQVVKQLTDAEPSARQRELERLAVRQSLNSLRSFPFVAAAEKDGELRLAGAWFAIAQGELHWLDEVSGVFEPVEA